MPDDTHVLSASSVANSVLQHSLLTGVPNIIATKNRCRKIFKILTLLLCACGFFYQATEFIRFILTYPSVVDIEVYVPDQYIGPAYTYCNSNGIKRSKFCSKYSDKCFMVTNETFCDTYSKFCSSFKTMDNIWVVKPEFYDFEKVVTFDELKELGSKNVFLSEMDNDTIGPILSRRTDGVLILCYTKYLRVNSSENPRWLEKATKFHRDIDSYTFDLEPQEVFLPYREPGAYFNVHTPFTYENPIEYGILMKPKEHYMFHLSMEEEVLLPHPYPSDCVNYTELWEKKKRSGPRSQEGCKELCVLSLSFSICNCSFPEVLFPIEGPYCSTPFEGTCSKSINENIFKEFERCHNDCKDDCEKRKYKYRVQSRSIEIDPSKQNLNVGVEVTVLSAEQEIVKYKFRPQYQDLEIFSYIGGFIGAWLGVSLVAVVDLMESLVAIVSYCLKRK